MLLNVINYFIIGVWKLIVSLFLDKMVQLGFGIVMGYSFDFIYDFFVIYKVDVFFVFFLDKCWNVVWVVGLGWIFS